LALIVNR